ncbi:low molecular weight protein-tyrosine-phosphatase [Aliiroseovarius sp. YM-037]|uniref:low molecular weight protein-tyrosine-phosphatase n=1 Tax=Aliiroseovarius sp. YM-037 TaxID=3341728 RepID=UPI003A805368
MTTRILFVCLGNICRSPTAEAVMRVKAKTAGLAVTLDSAGTSGWHIGEPPYGPMQAAAMVRGYDLSTLRARAFTSDDFDRFDLIIGMDDKNIADMAALRPVGNKTPLKSFMDFAPDTGTDAVPDPYYTRDFDTTLTLVESASNGLVAYLAQ